MDKWAMMIITKYNIIFIKSLQKKLIKFWKKQIKLKMFQVLDKIDKIIFYLNKNKIMIFNN